MTGGQTSQAPRGSHTTRRQKPGMKFQSYQCGDPPNYLVSSSLASEMVMKLSDSASCFCGHFIVKGIAGHTTPTLTLHNSRGRCSHGQAVQGIAFMTMCGSPDDLDVQRRYRFFIFSEAALTSLRSPTSRGHGHKTQSAPSSDISLIQ